jgi:maltooligosyltrehalose synthase
MMTKRQYEPIAASGEFAKQLFAYRMGGSDCAVVVVPRLTRRLRPIAATGVIGAVWGSTSLPLGATARWRCVLTGRDVDAAGGAVKVADLLSTLPVAVLTPA